MIRSFLRSVTQFLTAVLLLGLAACAVEVGMRAYRLNQRLGRLQESGGESSLTIPSPASWRDVRPLMDLERESQDGRGVRIRTNEHGLRHPTVVLPKPRETYRILCLGGDSIFGAEYSDEATVPAHLQGSLVRHGARHVEVINAGCPQSGPLINYLRYRRHLFALQADLVLICLRPEDLRRDDLMSGVVRLDSTRRRPAYAPHPVFSSQGNDLVDGLCGEFLVLDYGMRMLGRATSVKTPDPADESVRAAGNRSIGLAALAPLHELAFSQSCVLAISIGPGGVARGPNGFRLDQTAQHMEQQLSELLERAQLSGRVFVHHGWTEFDQTPELTRLFLSPAGELSAEGNEFYGASLARFLSGQIGGFESTSTPDATNDYARRSGLNPIPSQVRQSGWEASSPYYGEESRR